MHMRMDEPIAIAESKPVDWVPASSFVQPVTSHAFAAYAGRPEHVEAV